MHPLAVAEKAERPNTGVVGEIAERVGAEVAGPRRPDQPRGRSERGEKREGLENETNGAVWHGLSRFCASPCDRMKQGGSP